MASERALVVVVALVTLKVVEAVQYTGTWAVHVPGGAAVAEEVAREHGFVNLGEIFDDHYHFKHNHVARRSTRQASEHHGRLQSDARVSWARQQKLLSRRKRDFLPLYITTESELQPSPSSSSKRETSPKRELHNTRVKGRPRAVDSKFLLNDPKWPHMWYLNRGGGLDMNVIPAWREGITGRGVVVTILDDGLETDHPDLAANYDPMASYDVNSHDSDPQPRYDMIDSNRHGTRCAGEVAATANNSLCAVGVAYGAKVGGVRMLDGDVTDAVEARSLSLNPQHVDIYSASWGPDDDGKTVDGPGELATRAFIEGVTKGRNGKGSIFVWASGNGGREFDNCNCDGYTNSIWTLSISSATERGDVPWYSEMCSSTLAATYSSGGINERQVITTDLHHSCTAGHTGTSASAPLAAGICALTLQANNDLTWRDMQHIVVRTARPERLSASGEWRVNGVGRNVSHSFGYGLLDAAGMVRLARGWRPVPPQRKCELAAPHPQRPVPPRSTVTLQLDVSSCPGVNYLEHVQARVSMSATRRGDLRVALVSPAGTRVTLLAPRAHDSSRAGFNSWPFMSVHTWGESPIGVWQLEVYNEGRYMAGPFTQWELIFYGTETPPQEDDISQDTNSLSGTPEKEKSPTWSVSKPPEIPEEVKDNNIEDDLPWHDSHTVRSDGSSSPLKESAPSGCSTHAPLSPHHCLECEKGFHLYAGDCYIQCPDGTYASEFLIERTSRRRNLTLLEKPVMKRHPINASKSASDTKAPLICLPCHYTCATCFGPENYHCTTCPDDAVPLNMTLLEVKVFCYSKSILPELESVKLKSNLNVALFVIIFIVASISLYCFISAVIRKYGICGTYNYDTNLSTAYHKLSEDEKHQSAIEIEDDINKALHDSSDSDSEDL